MSLLSESAEKAYGPAFTTKASAVAGRLGVDRDWLLGAISMETGGFSVSGPPWKKRNPKDHGGGLIGFTRDDGGAWEHKGPVDQLDDVEAYFRAKMRLLDVTTFRSPAEFYMLVRGPSGLLMGPAAPMGAGVTKQQVVDIINTYFSRHGLTWTLPNVGVEGSWTAKIGSWTGRFVFDTQGSMWWAALPQRGPGSVDPTGRFGASAEREVPYAARTYGRWECAAGKVRWRFWPQTDIRRFEILLPVSSGKAEGRILPAGQGTFQMWRGAREPRLQPHQP